MTQPPAQSSASPLLRIGTRGSPLALAQARQVRAQIAAVRGCDLEEIAIEVIRTTGDKIQDRPLHEAGGKGLFTKEIEEALLAKTVDIAVHSAKDLPTFLPPGLGIAAVLEREDARDVFISRIARSVRHLPHGAVVGTASPRREALVRRLRPDLRVVNLRGNVETRLRKLEAREVDATLLALAGLKRLGLEEHVTALLDIETFVPACGQGVIAIETRLDDPETLLLLRNITHYATAIALATERAFLAVLDGSCRTPIAGHAVVSKDKVTFRGLIARQDGSEVHETTRAGLAADAMAMGEDAAQELKGRASADFFVMT